MRKSGVIHGCIDTLYCLRLSAFWKNAENTIIHKAKNESKILLHLMTDYLPQAKH